MAPPNVLAITFMNSEAAFPPGYLRRQCLEFLKLGLMGVTVVVASGDWGTESGLHNTCINPDTGADNATTGYFNPSWPASCPWVTAVGGTQPFFSHLNSTGHATTGPSRGKQPQNSSLETAFNIHIQNTTASSGGGFSNIEKVPIYQTHAVSWYKHLDRAHLISVQDRFSPVGRGYPDVALLAYRYLVVSGGTLQYVHGTSASAPVFASMISLINNDRLHAGKAPVGFVNPALYSHPEVLNDVTTGFNTGCGVEVAFQSVKGWDPVTGLGSPDYKRMQKLFLGLP
ncbi:hypothetical protein CNMCM7691_004341 [Aspergillus felis]|nr:hypothetical protein CNMCM7691_004341 [Aspergillus felis]